MDWDRVNGWTNALDTLEQDRPDMLKRSRAGFGGQLDPDLAKAGSVNR